MICCIFMSEKINIVRNVWIWESLDILIKLILNNMSDFTRFYCQSCPICQIHNFFNTLVENR